MHPAVSRSPSNPAEHTALADGSVELVAVAQALHWFDRPRFFAECARVLRPGGVLAAWGYQDFLPPEGMTDAVDAFRAQIEPYWPPERAQVDAHYAGYDWPFPALPVPTVWLEAEWTLPRFLRYLSSSSATARCRAATGEDPVARHAPALSAAWGDPTACAPFRGRCSCTCAARPEPAPAPRDLNFGRRSAEPLMFTGLIEGVGRLAARRGARRRRAPAHRRRHACRSATCSWARASRSTACA